MDERNPPVNGERISVINQISNRVFYLDIRMFTRLRGFDQ